MVQDSCLPNDQHINSSYHLCITEGKTIKTVFYNADVMWIDPPLQQNELHIHFSPYSPHVHYRVQDFCLPNEQHITSSSSSPPVHYRLQDYETLLSVLWMTSTITQHPSIGVPTVCLPNAKHTHSFPSSPPVHYRGQDYKNCLLQC